MSLWSINTTSLSPGPPPSTVNRTMAVNWAGGGFGFATGGSHMLGTMRMWSSPSSPAMVNSRMPLN